MKTSTFRSFAFAAAALLMAGSALADDFLVSKRKHPQLGDTTIITVVAQQDAVTVTSIKVNRGNCQLYNKFNSPFNGEAVGQMKMKYGNEFTFFAGNFCNPLELELMTDKGVFRTNWSR
jgi:hypothetical protein